MAAEDIPASPLANRDKFPLSISQSREIRRRLFLESKTARRK
jgi:hypothetical protein